MRATEIGATAMPSLTDRAWSPYLTGVIIGLLQIPAFLLLGTALGTSSSYVTVGGSLAAFIDPGIHSIEYATKHLSGAKNWWQGVRTKVVGSSGGVR